MNNNISEALTERIKSPFIASFILSWSAINWKFFALLLLGNTPIINRINEADKILSINSLYIALTIAVIYTFIWPWITHLIITYQAGIKFIRTKELVNEEHEIELQKTKHNLAKIRYEMREQHAIEKLLKTQGQFKTLVSSQREFIKDADALLAEAEERASKIGRFQHMLDMFQENFMRFET